MSIEIKKSEEDGNLKLFINGTEVNNSHVLSYDSIQVLDGEIAQQLINIKFKELAIVEKLYLLPLQSFESKINLNVKIRFYEMKDYNCNVEFYIQPDIERWNNSFTFSEYKQNFLEGIKPENILNELNIYPNHNIQGIPIIYQYVNQIDIDGQFNIGDETIADFIDKYIYEIEKIDQEVYIHLLELNPAKVLVSEFLFPEQIKSSCEQYLIYFVKFLQDLGISANSNLKEEAGKVLFSVTPTDDIEALDKIREALALYLHLPESPIIYNESFAAMRLQQQIENLQHSQRMTEREIRSSERELRLAQTVIEHQDKLILQKDTVIGQQNKIIEKITSTSIMMDSLENKEEFEKVFDGLEFGESKELKEKLGIKFNPVTSLKSLGKKISGRDEEITSLNLNVETDKIIER
jgi:hypothetical protein